MIDPVPIPAKSPTASLLSDRHRELEDRLDDVRALNQRHSYVTAARCFGQLYRAIEEHVATEEKVWLPRIEARWPERRAVAEHARADHAAIRQQMERVSQALAGWRAREAGEALEELSRILAAHHTHEDEELYPAVLALRLLTPLG